MKLTILKVLALALLIAAPFVVFVGRDQAHAQQVNQLQTSATPTAGQSHSYKNIKVLTDLPERQLPQVMEFFATSVGRRCDFCHVNNNGQWDFAADTKPEKNTAREMIKMVLDLHKQKFAGSADIGCYTCHRGRTSPVGLPQLPLPDPPARPSPPLQGATSSPTPGQTSTGPTADQVLEKYLNAVDGQATLGTVKTRMVKANQGLPNGPAVTFELYQSDPDRTYMTFATPQGMVERGFNGTVGWEKNASGVHELGGAQLQGLRGGFDNLWFILAKFKEQYPRIGEQVRKDKIDGHDVYVVRANNPDGRRAQLAFDTDTGLLRRVTKFTPTMIGVIPAQEDFDDYRDVGGVKVAFSVVLAILDVGNPRSVVTLSEARLNPSFDDSKFNKPAP